jgi:hypothetical protein
MLRFFLDALYQYSFVLVWYPFIHFICIGLIEIPIQISVLILVWYKFWKGLLVSVCFKTVTSVLVGWDKFFNFQFHGRDIYVPLTRCATHFSLAEKGFPRESPHQAALWYLLLHSYRWTFVTKEHFKYQTICTISKLQHKKALLTTCLM